MMNSKKIVVFFVVSAMLVSSFAGISALNIASDDSNIITLNFNFDKPEIGKLVVDEKEFTSVSISGLYNSDADGEPSLPKQTAKILLPPKSDVVSIDLIKSGKSTISNVKDIELGCIAYYPLSLPNVDFVSVDKDNDEYAVYLDNDGAQKIDRFSPKYDISVIYPNEKSCLDLGVQYKRGFPILTVDVFPTQYDTKSQTLTYYTDVTLKVTTETDDSLGLNEMYRGLDRDFDVVGEIVDNPSMINSYKQLSSNQIDAASSGNKEGSMLIISTEELASHSSAYSLQALANAHKNKDLEEVYIKTIESIDAEYSADLPSVNKNWKFENVIAHKVRECVRDYYLNYDVDYVLLAGDDDWAYEESFMVPGVICNLVRWENIKDPNEVPTFQLYLGTIELWKLECEPGDDCCFPAGTMISMNDGSLKPIEDMEVGDYVLSYDLDAGQKASCKVIETVSPLRDGVYSINDGLVKPTDDHPFYVKKSDGQLGWAAINPSHAEAGYNMKPMQLEVGDQLFTSDGQWVTITSIVYEPGVIQTFNLEDVSGESNFFANGLLVHNAADCAEPRPSKTCWACNGETAVSKSFSNETICGKEEAVSYPYSSRPDCSDDDPDNDGPESKKGEEIQMVKCWKCNGETAACGFFSEGTVCGQGSAVNYPYSSCPDCTDDDDNGPDVDGESEEKEVDPVDPVDDGPDVDGDVENKEADPIDPVDPVDDHNDVDSTPSKESSSSKQSSSSSSSASDSSSAESSGTQSSQSSSEQTNTVVPSESNSIEMASVEERASLIESKDFDDITNSEVVDGYDGSEIPVGNSDGGGTGGGDSSCEWVRVATRHSTTASDLPFSCLDGSVGGPNKFHDRYGEVYVGRAPVDTVSELNDFVRKTLSYMNAETSDYNGVLMVGEFLGFGGIMDHAKASMEELLDGCNEHGYRTVGIPTTGDGFKYNLRTLFEKIASWFGAGIISKINAGNLNMVNHLGHANIDFNMKLRTPDYTKYDSVSGILSRNVQGLRNGQYPIFYSQGCFAGAYDSGEVTHSLFAKLMGSWLMGKPYYDILKRKPMYGDCIAEYITVKNNNGGVAGIWNSHFGWGRFCSTDGPSQRYHREFIDAIYGEGKTPIGWANQDSKEDNIGRLDSYPMKWLYYCINLIGDPALRVKGANYDPINDNHGTNDDDGSSGGGDDDNTVIDGGDSGNDGTFLDNLRTFLRDLLSRILPNLKPNGS